jgi:hypothetical protein
MSFRLKEEAAAARQWAEDRGINVASHRQVVATLLQQEVVSYSNEHGTVTFDHLDLEESVNE